MLNIYNYSCPNTFLKDCWKEKKQKNPSFSIRSLAKRLELKSNASLSLIFNDQRAIPRSYIPKIIELFLLNRSEGHYFELLVNYKYSKSFTEKKYYLDAIKSINPEHKIHMSEVNHFKFFASPLSTIILEMMNWSEFKLDFKWIQSCLTESVSIVDIQNEINLLKELNIIEVQADGSVIKNFQNITNSPDIKNLGAREYCKKASQLAVTAIDSQPIESREFSSYTFNIDPAKLQEAKDKIRSFYKSFFAEFACDQETSTYQISTHLFKVAELSSTK